MSVVLVTADSYDTLRKTVNALLKQTVRRRLEVVIVAPSKEEAKLDHSDLCQFGHFRLETVGDITSIAAANATGIRAATAPIVALGEDHAFPEPGWAEALISAHRGPWAAVGPVLRNANPRTLVSWADLFVAYAPWLDPAPSGVRDHLPGHNSSYKRDILLSYGPRLDQMLASESVLHWDLRMRGYELYLESAAKTAHTNFSVLSVWLVSKFYSGRVFAATRAACWRSPKRLVFVAAAPLIPLLRLFRILRDTRRSRQPVGRLLRIFPVLLAGLSVSALGEMVGYGAGHGNAREKLSAYEFQRERYLAKKDLDGYVHE